MFKLDATILTAFISVGALAMEAKLEILRTLTPAPAHFEC